MATNCCRKAFHLRCLHESWIYHCVKCCFESFYLDQEHRPIGLYRVAAYDKLKAFYFCKLKIIELSQVKLITLKRQ